MSARESITAALLVALACLPITACVGSKATTAPASGGQYQDGDDPLTELARLEQRMLELGIHAAPDAPAGAGEGAAAAMDEDASIGGEAEAEADAVEEAPANEAAADAPSPPPPRERRAENQARADQCEDVCDLSEAICDLEQHICSLSESHQGDPTYVNACRRAADDCAVSGDACDRCDV